MGLRVPPFSSPQPYVATMPERVLKMAPRTLPLKIFSTSFPTPEHHELLLWHNRHNPDPAHAWLRELIVAITRKLP